MRLQVHSASPHETVALGKKIGACLPNGAIVGLVGDLGTGKTCLTKGIVEGIGGCDPRLVKSPAYNLIHEYSPTHARNSIYHIDFYRLDKLHASDELLFDEILRRPDVITIVEWADKFLSGLVSHYLSITLSKLPDQRHRTIDIQVVGSSQMYAALWLQIAGNAHALS